MSNTHKIGALLTFIGYSQPTPDGKLVKDEAVTVVELKDDDSYIVENKAGAREHVFFPDEVKVPEAAAGKTRTRAADKAETKADTKASTKADAKAPNVKGGGKAAMTAAEKKKADKAAKEAEAKKLADKKAKEDAKEAEKVKKAAEKAERDRIKAEEKAKRDAEKAERNKPVQVVDTEILTAVLDEHKGDSLAAAAALITQVEETYFSLGGVLAHINFNGDFKKAGEKYSGTDGFKLYCDEVLEIGYRRAMYWIGIYTYFTGLGFTEADLTGMGWAKAKELVNLTEDAEKAKEHVEYAQNHSKVEVIEYAKEIKKEAESGGEGSSTTTRTAGTSGEKVTCESFKFSFVGAEAETVNSALKRSMEILGGENPNAALLQIITEWAASIDGGEITQEQAISMVENRFGIELAVAGEGDTEEPEQKAA